METRIYYFSATGNSLLIARSLAEGLGGAELIPIPRVVGTPVSESAGRVGFVFPVVAWGLPMIVAEFLKGLTLTGNPYVFAVATCGGTPARTLLELRGLLKKAGADLHAGYACAEGANTVVADDPGFIRLARRLNRIKYAPGKARLDEILATIREGRRHAPETSSPACNLYGGMMHGMMAMMGDKLKQADSAYRVDDRCTGCRTCERVCPRANVRVEGGRPVWHHNCEVCNGCIQWCPQQAIHTANDSCRYRNPAVRAEDLMLR